MLIHLLNRRFEKVLLLLVYGLIYHNINLVTFMMIHLRIEFYSGCIYWIMNAMVKLANP